MEVYHARDRHGFVLGPGDTGYLIGDPTYWGFDAVRGTTVALLRSLWQIGEAQRQALTSVFASSRPNIINASMQTPQELGKRVLAGLWSDVTKLVEDMRIRFAALLELGVEKTRLLQDSPLSSTRSMGPSPMHNGGGGNGEESVDSFVSFLSAQREQRHRSAAVQRRHADVGSSSVSEPYAMMLNEEKVIRNTKHLRVTLRVLMAKLLSLAWFVSQHGVSDLLLGKQELVDLGARTISYLIVSVVTMYANVMQGLQDRARSSPWALLPSIVTCHAGDDLRAVMAHTVLLLMRCAGQEGSSTDNGSSSSPVTPTSVWKLLQQTNTGAVLNSIADIEVIARSMWDSTVAELESARHLGDEEDPQCADDKRPGDEEPSVDEDTALSMLEQHAKEMSAAAADKKARRRSGKRFLVTLADDGRFEPDLLSRMLCGSCQRW
ncbi:hypothetical protein PINS_up019788 [Pythium insidiosum]|nr:hypothetical protein PINS_up019788 [Pythium insidiosum]